MDNSQSHQQRRGSLVPLSPFHTPSLMSEKSSRDSRSSDGNSSNKHDKDRGGVNVQVILRCRPLSEDEVRVRTPVVIACNELKCEVAVAQNIANKQIDRTFVFDKVFGPMSQQKDSYDHAVGPIVNEALEGYNCTIFAYGQTGSGKTYTMEGEGSQYKNGELHKDAGVIPRAVQHIFYILEAQKAEYSMKVTFLELYNEEISDLLGPDGKSKKPIALMEDGKGAVFVRGLKEEMVWTADEIFEILAKGSAKKHTAETLLSKQTNRSHSIFSITIHTKECTPEGIELIKCGKLNLVDLAGSENILRSGAREGRVREAGEINKSLLTLGRVINALAEQSRHVPYRASKLTRLLRDSLGGKTKTCIIATISPSIHCLEETLSTLDYAYRAKNIKNRPEVNQKVIKSALLKDLYIEIDHLKQESHATREKNGISIPRDSYVNDEAVKKAMAEKIERVELDSKFKDKQMKELQGLYIYQQQLTEELREKLAKTQRELDQNEHALYDVEDRCRQANETIKEKEYLIFNLLGSEQALTEQTFKLRDKLETAASEVSVLFANFEHKNKIEDGNKILIQNFHTQLVQQLQVLHKTVADSMTQHEQQLKVIEDNIQSFTSAKARATIELQVKLKKLKDMYSSGIKSLDELAGGLGANFELAFGHINSVVSSHSSSLVDLFGELSSEIDAVLNDLRSNLNNQEEEIAAFAQKQSKIHSRTLQTTQSISRVTVNFFKTLSMYVSKLILMAEEAQTISDQKICALEKQFEEHGANEERQLLDEVAELLASSNERKKKLVQTTMDCLRESASSRTSKLHEEISNMQDLTSSVQEEWTSYMGKTEAQNMEDSIALEIQKDGFVEDIRHCMTKARMVAENWQNAQESILSLQRRSVNSVDSTVQSAMEDNQMIRTQFSSFALSMLEEADATDRSFLSSIQNSLKLDSDGHAEIISLIAPSCEDMRGMKTAHSHKIIEITENAGKCLIDEYMVDKHLWSTPRKRLFDLPSMKSIEDLRTPSFEELLESFQAAGSVKQANGDVNISPRPYEIAHSL